MESWTMRKPICLGLLICLFGRVVLAADYPKAEISNQLIRAELMLPDALRGSYRATRFDWSGIVSSLQFAGHEYFGQWYEHHDPKINDAITGPVEEFLTHDSGLGYDEAKPGGTFLRIGVGVLRKPDEKVFRRFETYDIVDPGKWTIRKRGDRIEFIQRLTSDNGYAYIYRKRLRLTKGKPQLVIEHSLKNTGRRAIETEQYNHNFFMIDREVVGPDISFRFTFVPKPDRELKNGAEIRGQEITYAHELQNGQGVFTALEGFGQDAKDYDIRIENRMSGAGVRITGDRPLAKMLFWSIRTVAAAEPYVQLRIEPGSEFHWKISYDFYTMAPSVTR